jgi:uncharacterized protein
MNCPTCQVALAVADRQGVEIDYCPRCRGVWLDRGELDKLIERANQYGYAQRRDDDDSHDGPMPGWNKQHHTPGRDGHGPPPGGHYPLKKKEGFFSRMFDFD